VKLAADANVLLDAVIGGRARIILAHPDVQTVFTTKTTLSEVEEYAPLLAEKKRLRPDVLLLTIAALPLTVVDRSEYSRSLPEAIRRIGGRDPDDAELLALALHFDIPLWSNDRDFDNLGVELYTTDRLLGRLGLSR